MKPSYMRQCPPVLKEYLGYAETIRGRSAGTVDEYFIDIRTFLRFLKQIRGLVPPALPEEEIPIDDVTIDLLKSVTLTDAYEYMNYLRSERQNTNKTRARKTSSLRMFFKYLTNYARYLDHNPLQNLDTPKLAKSLPRYLTVEQSIELLGSTSGEFAERDYCMMTLFLNCGLRRAELAGINLTDISFHERTLRVRGKGSKERMLFLNDACIQALEQYLKVRPVDGVQDKNALFLSRLKKRISLQGIHYVVKGYLQKIGGCEEMTTHKLRHTAATLMYQHGGVDLRVLQNILGHESLGTTEIYTHLSSQQLEAAAQSNPLSQVTMSKKGKRKSNNES